MVKPPWSLLLGERKWVPAAETDIRKTFARVRAEQKRAEGTGRFGEVVKISMKGKS